MDQVKIGKFIAECRKNKKLTQAQLAEKLDITDRAVSKWETGKGMPDSSIMLELCSILEINVNELLRGEKVKMENYHKIAEENLLKMKQSEEEIEKKMRNFQLALTLLCVIFSIFAIGIFILHLVMNYIYPETYDGKLFEALSPLAIILCLLSCITGFVLNFREKYEIRVKR